MDTNWTLTEFDLTKLVIRRRSIDIAVVTVGIVCVIITSGIFVFAPIVYKAYWNDWFGWAGPWLAGLIMFAFVLLMFRDVFLKNFKETSGLGVTADLTDQYSLNDILADQPDPIGQVAGVSARDVLQATNTMLSGPSSEQATPPERRPDRRIISGLLRIILWILIGIVALAAVAYSVSSVEPLSPTLSPFLTNLQAFLTNLQAYFGALAPMVGFLLFLLARTRKKSAEHLLEYDQRPPIVFLRSFKDDCRLIWVARQFRGKRGRSQYIGQSLVGFEDALSQTFFRIGPFIALGARQDFIPRLGAARSYRDDSVWQAKAKSWMKDATWILYMLGSTEGLKWETEQITLNKLLGKTIFLFPPNVGVSSAAKAVFGIWPAGWVTKATLKKRRLQNWNNFLRMFANTEFHSALSEFDESNAIVMWIGPDRHIFVVRGRGKFSQEYDLALRIAIYLKRSDEHQSGDPRMSAIEPLLKTKQT
jgi:hypothetical protein